MKNSFIFSFCLLLLLTFACKKTEDLQPNEAPVIENNLDNTSVEDGQFGKTFNVPNLEVPEGLCDLTPWAIGMYNDDDLLYIGSVCDNFGDVFWSVKELTEITKLTEIGDLNNGGNFGIMATANDFPDISPLVDLGVSIPSGSLTPAGSNPYNNNIYFEPVTSGSGQSINFEPTPLTDYFITVSGTPSDGIYIGSLNGPAITKAVCITIEADGSFSLCDGSGATEAAMSSGGPEVGTIAAVIVPEDPKDEEEAVREGDND